MPSTINRIALTCLLTLATTAVVTSTAGAAAAAESDVASDVHSLDKNTFPGFIKEHDLVLAEFFAPWCGHCKALAPEYEDAAIQLKEKNIPLAKIDCTEQAELCSEHGVEGYPTLKIFRGPESPTNYSGPRKSQAIVSHMIKQSLPIVSPLDKSSLSSFKSLDKVVIVAYIAASDKSSNSTFHAVAEKLRDTHVFGAITDSDLAKSEGITQPAVVVYKTFDLKKDIFSAKFDSEAIIDFVKLSSLPIIGEVGPETYSSYMEANIPLAYIFSDSQEDRDELVKKLKPIALKHRGAINFATIDAALYGQHATSLNLELGKWPAFAIQDIVNNKKFPYNQSKKIEESTIAKFTKEFVDGKLEPSIKSQPIPEDQNEPVTVIVAKTFDKIVMDNSKDVLVEFYAPWCGHCKSLAPKYEQLGARFKNESEKIVIAKIDATANDVPIEIEGFPTIKLYPSGAKSSPVAYSGDRSVRSLVEFVRDNGKWKVDVTADMNNDPDVVEGINVKKPVKEQPVDKKEKEDGDKKDGDKKDEDKKDGNKKDKDTQKSARSSTDSASATKESIKTSSSTSSTHDEL